MLGICYCRQRAHRKVKQDVRDLQGPDDSEWPASSHSVPGTVVPYANDNRRSFSLEPALPPSQMGELHQQHAVITPFSLDTRSLEDGQSFSARTAEPTVTENRLSTGQVEFVHDLYRMNVPAPAIADVMDRMLREGEGSVSGNIKRKGTTVTRRTLDDKLRLVNPEVSPPSYDYKSNSQ
jgi:hypothetical protein